LIKRIWSEIPGHIKGYKGWLWLAVTFAAALKGRWEIVGLATVIIFLDFCGDQSTHLNQPDHRGHYLPTAIERFLQANSKWIRWLCILLIGLIVYLSL
jgi:hypothetical protein